MAVWRFAPLFIGCSAFCFGAKHTLTSKVEGERGGTWPTVSQRRKKKINEMHVAFMYFIIWPSSKEKEKETSDGEKDGEDWG